MPRRLIALVVFVIMMSSVANANTMPSNIFRSAGRKATDDSDSSHLQRGFNLLRKNDTDGACIEFRACKNILIASDGAILLMSKTFRETGQPATGVALLTKFTDYAKTASPTVNARDLGQAFKERADCLYALQNYPAAVADYKKAASVDPQDSGYDYRMAGDCCRKQKKYDEALKLFDLAVPRGTDWLELFFQRGQCLSEVKRYPEAIAEYSKIIEQLLILRRKSPERFTALLRDTYTERVRCHDALGQKVAADADRKSLMELARGWEQDLFGDASIPDSHK